MGLLHRLWEQWQQKPAQETTRLITDSREPLPHVIAGARRHTPSGRLVEATAETSFQWRRQVYAADRELMNEALADAAQACLHFDFSIQRNLEVWTLFHQLLQAAQSDLVKVISQEKNVHPKIAAASIQRFLTLFTEQSTATIQPLNSMGSGHENRFFSRRPLGKVLVIDRSDFDLCALLWLMFNLTIYGNAVVVQPDVRQAAVMIFLADLLKSAGLEEGRLHVLQGDDATAAALIEHPHVDAVFQLAKGLENNPMAPDLAKVALRLPIAQIIPAQVAVVVFEDADLQRLIKPLLQAWITGAYHGAQIRAVLMMGQVAATLPAKLQAALAKLMANEDSQVPVPTAIQSTRTSQSNPTTDVWQLPMFDDSDAAAILAADAASLPLVALEDHDALMALWQKFHGAYPALSLFGDSLSSLTQVSSSLAASHTAYNGLWRHAIFADCRRPFFAAHFPEVVTATQSTFWFRSHS